MSTIIEALKKAAAEEEVKKESGADRVLWLRPNKKNSFKQHSTTIWLALFTIFLGLIIVLIQQNFSFLQQVLVNKPTQIAEEKSQEIIPKEHYVGPVLPEPPTLTLSGIIWDKNEPIALIGSKTFKVGDPIKGGIITNITPEKVQVTFNDEILTFFLDNE